VSEQSRDEFLLAVFALLEVVGGQGDCRPVRFPGE
jgi:hypothetical protein